MAEQQRYIPLSDRDSKDARKLQTDLNRTMSTNYDRGVPMRGNKVLENPLTALQQRRYEVINLYVTDALNARPPNTIIQASLPEPGVCGITVHMAYKMCHNHAWAVLVYWCIWVQLGLIFWEPYANINLHYYPWPLYIIEIAILGIYSMDVYLHKLSHDPRNYWDLKWVKLIVVCIAITFIDVLLSIALQYMVPGHKKSFFFRFAAVLRPIFLVCRSQFLRATVRSIYRSVPRVLDVLFLVCLYILMFAILGYVLFSEHQLGYGYHVVKTANNVTGTCNNYGNNSSSPLNQYDTDCDKFQKYGNVNFQTLLDSILSLCVLMSTANFPDVMMPSFHYSQTTGLFFAIFIAFGIYYLMSIIFAVVYHHYHEDNARYVDKMTNNRALSLDFAFRQMIILGKESNQPKFEISPQDKADIDYNSEVIYFGIWRTFLRLRRKNISEDKCRILYNAVSQVRNMKNAVKLSEDDGNGISREQWQDLYHYVNVEIFRDPANAVADLIKSGRSQTMINLILGEENMYSMGNLKCCQSQRMSLITGSHDHIQGRCCSSFVHYTYLGWLHFRSALYRLFTHSVVSRVIDFLVWGGTVILIIEISMTYNASMDYISDLLVRIFVVEVTLRWIAFGRYFWQDKFNVIDFVVVYASFIADTLADSEGVDADKSEDARETRTNAFVALRVLRFVRALGTIDRFKLIIKTSFTVIKSLCVLFSLEFCVFYIFAVCGLFIFEGKITQAHSLDKLYHATKYNNVDDIVFWEYIRDAYYYDNNMNFVGNSLMVLLEMTVVNQWHAVTQMYVQLTNYWAYVYFYFFYFVSVIIVMNVLTAFIFDAFIIQFQKFEKDEQDIKKKRKTKKKLERIRRYREKVMNKTDLFNSKSDRDIKQKLLQLDAPIEKRDSNVSLNIQSKRMTDCPIISAIDSYDNKKQLTREGKVLNYALNTTEDILQEMLHENEDKEEWHKWVSRAMIFEFNLDDMVRGIWRYRRPTTVADFYENMYEGITKQFNDYIAEWKEQLPDEYRNEHIDREYTLTDNSTIRTLPPMDMTPNISAMGADDSDLYDDHPFKLTTDLVRRRTVSEATAAMVFADDSGNVNQVSILGPKQTSIFGALSCAPQVGFAPMLNTEQATKVNKLLDITVNVSNNAKKGKKGKRRITFTRKKRQK